ncbi:response regulator [Nocardia cyriacigeorgica]|uniref:response regulator n=1 Tax=Nocardia cyriacigeorgica TaxID=135487 RepID=UPI002458FA4F|nr:response regulator [Nocardia cyriacigeorgica]
MTSADFSREHCVLVVDDDHNVRESLQRGLELSGFAVLTAGDGAQAIRSCTEHDPDVIVLDMQMPRLSGLGVITALRAAGNDVPICVLSAHSAPDNRIMGLQAGADDYLVKPFVFDELTARLHALLRRHRVTRPEPARAEPLTVGSLHVDLAGRGGGRAAAAAAATPPPRKPEGAKGHPPPPAGPSWGGGGAAGAAPPPPPPPPPRKRFAGV